MPQTTIAIAGFTGKMARLITSALLTSHPTIKIHGICRSPSKVDPKIASDPAIEVFQAESNDTTSLRKALAGASACICCYLGDSAFMVEGQKTLIEACIAEKVPRYVASDWCMDFRGLAFGDHPSKDPMKYVHAYLEEKEGAGLIKGIHVLTGGFMEFYWVSFLEYVDAEKGLFTYYGSGEDKLDMATMPHAAEFTAAVAVDSTAIGFLNVLGDRKTIKEMAQLYERVYGLKPSVQRLGSMTDLREKMLAAYEGNADNPYAWLAKFYQYYLQQPATRLKELDNGRYQSAKTVTLEDFLRKYTKDTVGDSSSF